MHAPQPQGKAPVVDRQGLVAGITRHKGLYRWHLADFLRHRYPDNQKQRAERKEPQRVEPVLTEANAGNHTPLLWNPCVEPDAVIGMRELGLKQFHSCVEL